MKKLDFNTGWTCKPLTHPGEEIAVLLPHDAMRSENRGKQSVGEANIGWFEGGDYEYRKVFTIPEELRDKELTLEFESVYHNAEVYLNGEKIAYRPYGYTNFYVDLNPYLKVSEENEIRVIAHNADQPNSRWYSGTGIYRPVWLYAAEKQHILMNGIKIDTLSIDPARIRVRVNTTGEGMVSLAIRDGEMLVAEEKKVIESGKQAEFVLEIPDAKLWDTENPNLYFADVKFAGDCETVRFGIRTLTWTPDKGVAINGKRVIIRGCCIHHDNGALGACTYPEVEARRLRILKECGYNAVRSAHNPCSKYQLDACDELGMLMMDEYVDCWYMHKTEHDYASYVSDWWKIDLKDMVEKDYNHPSVIIYSTGNEVAETAQKKGIALQKEFTEYLHELDPSRPVTCGINIFFNFLSSAGFGVYSDEKAQKQAEAAKKAAEKGNNDKPKKKAVGSEFYNMLAARLGCDFMKFGASLPPCDWKTKDAFGVMDIAGYNYGNWRYRKDAKKYPDRLILGSETLVGDAYHFWETAKEVPQVVGDFVWAGWDYMGECGLGASNYPDYMGKEEEAIRGGNNGVDMTGKKMPDIDYTRVAFELEKGPKLAAIPAYEKTKPEITGWQLTSAIRSWTYPGCNGNDTQVEVYARADSVKLYLNNKCVGKKKITKGCRVVFPVKYEDGKLMAISYDKNGKEIGRDILRTAGPETELRLEAESTSCKPGEMLFFRIRYTDAKGEVKPMEKHIVSVEAENGEVVGTANGNNYRKGKLTDTSIETYFAEAQAVVRAGAPGVIKVTVTDGQRSCEAEVICEA